MLLVISNIIGFVALSFWIYSIQLYENNKILKFQLLANLFYAIQYFLIGAITAGIMNIISTIRYYIFYKNAQKGKENSKILLIIFILTIIIAGLITYQSLIDLIPFGITIIYTYMTWQKNTKIIRYIFTIVAFIWVYYNTTVQAYASSIGNIMEIISGGIAIYRFDSQKKEEIRNNPH